MTQRLITVYGYVFTRLQYPQCETTVTALKSWEICGVPETGLIDENQADCRFC